MLVIVIIAAEDYWLQPSFGSSHGAFWYHESSGRKLWGQLQLECSGPHVNNRDLPFTSVGQLGLKVIYYDALGVPLTTLTNNSKEGYSCPVTVFLLDCPLLLEGALSAQMENRAIRVYVCVHICVYIHIYALYK